jgi:hypothetical protein
MHILEIDAMNYTAEVAAGLRAPPPKMVLPAPVACSPQITLSKPAVTLRGHPLKHPQLAV